MVAIPDESLLKTKGASDVNKLVLSAVVIQAFMGAPNFTCVFWYSLGEGEQLSNSTIKLSDAI